MIRPLALTLFLLGIIGNVFYLYRKKKRQAKDVSPLHDVPPIHDVLFFPDKEYVCTSIMRALSSDNKSKSAMNIDVCYNPSCRRLHGRPNESSSSMLKFLMYLSSSKLSVDLCIYIFTQSNFADILRHLHKNNVRIRIIADLIEGDAYGNQLEHLRSLGIMVKSNPRGTGTLMHHKFVVLDNKIVMTGSFNWTNKAITNNFESVIVTSSQEVVQPFIHEFQELWDQFG